MNWKLLVAFIGIVAFTACNKPAKKAEKVCDCYTEAKDLKGDQKTKKESECAAMAAEYNADYKENKKKQKAYIDAMYQCSKELESTTEEPAKK